MATVLLAATAVVVMPALATASRVVTISEGRTKAYLFALSKLSELEIALAGGADVKDSSGQAVMEGQRLQWQLSVAPVAEDAQLRNLALTVHWPRGKHTDTYRFDQIMRLRTQGA